MNIKDMEMELCNPNKYYELICNCGRRYYISFNEFKEEKKTPKTESRVEPLTEIKVEPITESTEPKLEIFQEFKLVAVSLDTISEVKQEEPKQLVYSIVCECGKEFTVKL